MSIFDLNLGQSLIVFAPALINLIALVHIIKRKDIEPNKRIIWFVACMFIPLITGIIYFSSYFLRRKKT